MRSVEPIKTTIMLSFFRDKPNDTVIYLFLAAPRGMRDLSSPTRESNWSLCSGSPNHQTSREALDDILLNTCGTIVLICVKISLMTQMVKHLPATRGTWVWSGRSPGKGNGNPLQYSCLKNSMNGGAWWATVHGVAKSQTQLSDFTFMGGLLGLLGLQSSGQQYKQWEKH